jgi:hypothetical protein
MSLLSSPKLASKPAEDRRILAKLDAAMGKEDELPFHRIRDLVGDASEAKLSLLLGELVDEGDFRLIYRVESPQFSSGIEDFGTVEEIPPEIPDIYAGGMMIPVTTANTRVLYRRAY